MIEATTNHTPDEAGELAEINFPGDPIREFLLLLEVCGSDTPARIQPAQCVLLLDALTDLTTRCAAAELERDALVTAIAELRGSRMRHSLDEAHIRALAWFCFERDVERATPPPADRGSE